MEFKPGNVVYHKSADFKMVVIEQPPGSKMPGQKQEGKVWCTWYDPTFKDLFRIEKFNDYELIKEDQR